MLIKNLSVLITVLILFSTSIFAENISVELAVDNNTIAAKESTTLYLTIKNAQNYGTPQIVGIENFDIMSQSNSQSVNMINFKTTITSETQFIISPKTEGRFQLKAFINLNGKKYESNVINLEVVKPSARNQNISSNEPIFLKTSLSNEKIYQGQKIALSYDLFLLSKFGLGEGSGFVDTLKLDNFIVKDVKTTGKPSVVQINNNSYQKYEGKKSILSPTNSGTINIPSMRLQANVIVDSGIFGTTKTVVLASEEKNLTVLPLPEENKPNNWSGIVGELNIDSSISSKEIVLGDAITYKIRLYGDVNLDRLDKLIKPEPEGFKIYEAEKSKTEDIVGGKYFSEKNLEIAIIPDKSGLVTFPEIVIPYFNPKSAKYDSIILKSFDINVKSNGSISTSTESSGNETITVENISVSDKDYYILKIKKSDLFLFSMIIIFVLVIISIIVIVLLLKSKNISHKEFTILLNELKAKEDKWEIYDILGKALKQKYGISIKSMTLSEIYTYFSLDLFLSKRIPQIVEFVENSSFGINLKLNIKSEVRDVIKYIKKI